MEEFVRWTTPVMTFRRTVTQDTELRGQHIREGDWVTIIYSSANRDERVFTNPYDFDITRSPNPHVGFGGGGPHYCMGSFMAKMQLESIFRELIFRAPNLRVRCAVDVFVNDGGKVLVIDWKTGRYKPEHEQDADFYGCMIDIGMGARSTTVQYIYTDEPQFSFDREIKDASGLARRLYAEFEEADAYLEKVGAEPPMNPAKHCGWCGDITCPNNKKAEAKRIHAQANTNVLFKGGA